MKATLVLFLLLAGMIARSQNVGIGTTTPHPSARLDVTAIDKGVLVPRLTSAQRTSIASPAQGLLVFDSDTGTFWYYNGFAWVNLTQDPLSLPYYNEGSAAVPTLTIMNNGTAAGIRGIGNTGPGLYGWGKGGGLAGVGVRADNTHASGIGVWSTTSSNDANAVFSNSGSGDLIRGFSGAGAGNLVYRVLNNGTLTTTGNIGIGTTGTPSARLEVNGNVKIIDGTQGTGKVLTSDASGNASWQSQQNNSAATTFFTAEKTGNASTHQFWAGAPGNHTELVTFPAEYADAGNNYNASTSIYTIPQSGYYFFSCRTTVELFADAHVWLELHAGSSAVGFAHSNLSNTGGNLKTVSLSHSGYFPAGSQVSVHITLPPGDAAFRHDSQFTGWRVY
jgi:hypothetical protein